MLSTAIPLYGSWVVVLCMCVVATHDDLQALSPVRLLLLIAPVQLIHVQRWSRHGCRRRLRLDRSPFQEMDRVPLMLPLTGFHTLLSSPWLFS